MITPQKKLTPEVMQQLRSKPGFMPLKIADVLWPGAVMRAQDTWTKLKACFFPTFSRSARTVGKRSEGTPQDPGYAPPRSEEELIYRRAENGEMVGYTPAEYGVRKDDGGGAVKPYNSSAGLLFLAVLLTACVGGLVYGVTQVALTDQWHILGSVWWVFPACLFPFLAAWAGYLKERKAEKIRNTRNLPRPVE